MPCAGRHVEEHIPHRVLGVRELCRAVIIKRDIGAMNSPTKMDNSVQSTMILNAVITNGLKRQ